MNAFVIRGSWEGGGEQEEGAPESGVSGLNGVETGHCKGGLAVLELLY